MGIKERIKNYFKMTEEEKDEVLTEIIEIYINVHKNRFGGNITVVDLMERDIKVFEDDEEFEAAQALKDILTAYYRILKEMKDEELINVIKELEKRNKENGL